MTAVKSMTTRYDINGRLTSFPTIEAIVDCCDVIVEAQKSLERALHPTIHLVLPRLWHCIKHLEMISQGAPVFRGEDRQGKSPSEFSVLMCKIMKNCLLEHVLVHNLWLAACVLHPFLREFSFVPDDQKRAQYKLQGEGMVRALMKQTSCFKDSTRSESTVGLSKASLDNLMSSGLLPVLPSPTQPCRTASKFSLLACADRYQNQSSSALGDELSKYLEGQFSYAICSVFENLLNSGFIMFKRARILSSQKNCF